MRWSLVVPVKVLTTAKTRLDVDPSSRAELALAMAADVVSAGVRTAAVSQVIVVTDDPRAREQLTAIGARTIPDLPDAGLNPALEHGAAVASELSPDNGVVVISSDVPAVTPDELGAALLEAEPHQRSFLPDSAGTGTTVLSARPGVLLSPRFGAASAQAHAASGASRLGLAAPGLRTDVDTVADLVAVLLGAPGAAPHTRSTAQALGLLPRH